VNAATVTVGPVSASGVHTITVSAVDKVGNTSSKVVTFSVDPSAPVTTIAFTPSTYLDNTWSASNVTFALTATDAPPSAGVAGIRYRIDGSAMATYTAPVAVTAEGVHTVNYWAIDVAGNQEATKTATIKVDKTKPVSSSNVTAEYDTQAVIALTATDTVSGVAGVYSSLDGAPAVVGTSVTSTLAGNHTLNFWAVDAAGNKEDTHTVTFHVTRQPAFLLASKVYFMNNTKNPAGVSITSWLKDGTTPVGGRRVILEYSSTSNFAVKGSVYATTTASGWFRFNRNITSRTYFRVRFAGDADYKATLSKTVAYVPKVALSTPAVRSPQRAKRAFTVTGKIYPAHKVGTRIKMERYQIVGKRRVSRGYVWAYVTARSRYAYSARLSLAKGTWQLRAVAPYDIAHAWTASGFRTIIVR